MTTVPEQATKMDEYEIKFAEMQKYIPFLEAMIERLKKVKDNTRAPQLQKMQSLHGILSDSKRKLKLETLQRCEEVLQKLHSKVEKGNPTGPKLPSNKNTDEVKPDPDRLLEPKKENPTEEETNKKVDMKNKIQFVKKMEDDETPASPSPPASPDQMAETSVVKPIIIPTERNENFTAPVDDRPASPDACEMIPSANAKPIIIPTERKDSNPLRKVDPVAPSQRIPTWTYPDGILPNRAGQAQTPWQPDPRGVNSRNRVIRHIPTALPPSKSSGPVLRKPILVLDKKSSETENEPAQQRLLSPEPDSQKAIKTSPKSKDLPPIPKLTSTLLSSPPPAPAVPPLTIEDLAELLQDGDSKKSDSNPESTKKSSEEDEAKKLEKKTEGKETSGKKDERSTKSSVVIDVESERRWDENDKLNGKAPNHQTNRRIFSSPSSSSSKHSSRVSSASSSSGDRPTDPRNRPPSPRQPRDIHKHNPDPNSAFSRNSEADPKISEDRALYHRRSYPGNGPSYTELDPRRDKNVEFYKNIIQRERDREREIQQEKQREREREMQRERERELQRERERDMQREREIEREMLGGNRGMMHHSPGRGEPCNQNQWAQNMNYPPGGPQGPNMYPQQQRPDRWMQGPNLPMEQHMMGEPGHMRPAQYQGPPNSCGRPMLSPQEMNMGPCMDMNMPNHMDMNMPNHMDMNMPNHMDMNMPNHMDMNMPPHMDPNCMDMNMGPRMEPGFREDMQNPNLGPQQHPNAIPPLIPPSYPMGPQYHQFPQENRPNQQFDRPQDFQHSRQGWEGNRVGENIQYSRPQGPPGGGPQGQWNRAPGRGNGNGPQTVPAPLMSPPMNQPGHLQGNRNFNDRPRGPDSSRNPLYNRDPRDPRSRPENSTNPQNANSTTAPTPRREHTRFSKEQPAPAKPREISNDRNQRKKGNDPEPNKHAAAKEKELEREKTRKREEKKRREQKNEKKVDKDIDDKVVSEKTSADVMHSPLESLYGVIDTAAKTGKGYGLQKFKIPKIRKPSTTPKIVDEPIEDNLDIPDDNTESGIEKNIETSETTRSTSKDDEKKSEVTSTTGESSDDPQIIETSESSRKESLKSKGHKKSGKSPESEPTVDTSTKNTDNVDSVAKEIEAPRLKEEVTQELIQALIRKSLESGEVKELFKSKLMQKFGEAFQGKKFKKILTIIDSDSDSSEKDPSEGKKSGGKKKRRVIESDSSEEECLAERLGKVDTRSKSDAKNSRVEEAQKATAKTKKKSNAGKVGEASKSVESDGGSKEKEENKKETKKKKADKKSKAGTSEKEADGAEVESEQQSGGKSKAPAKSKPRRRNSLEMLQEDIREMFISEGVVSATGHRMCRLVKEAQEQLINSAVEREQAKKKRSVSLDRQEARNESDAEVERPQSVNSKQRAGKSKSRRRTRGARPKSRKSGQENASSDSETEDSVRTEISGVNETNDAEKSFDESTRMDAGDNSKSSKDDIESSHFLRRSERVGLRESTRATRGSSKNANNVDSSKIIFDSSSDESFGIDVSELTAAVDISLHSESRGRLASSPAGKGSTTKSKKQKGKARRSKRIERTDVVASADEVESIASDLSRASSLTRGKRGNLNQDTNEELMSHLLTGLVDPKTSSNKTFDDDADNENDSVPASDLKTGVRKKKKTKKGTWAMGVVKKKKKKQPSRVSTPSELESSLGMSGHLESTIEVHETKPNVNTPMNIETKKERLSDCSPTKSTSNIDETVLDNKPKDEPVVGKAEPVSPVKSLSAASTSDQNSIEDRKPLEETDDKDDSSTLPKPLNIAELIEYVWSTKKDKYNCLYCDWSGKNIVHHYTLSHGEKETLISRLSAEDSKLAIEEAQSGSYDERDSKTVTQSSRLFQCRFCSFEASGPKSTALEAFYEHCTTHTGEYRFRCQGCTYQTVVRSSMRTHCYRRRHKPCRNSQSSGPQAMLEDRIPEEDFLYGYICTKCNFVQLKESNVTRHVKMYHENSPDAQILKIDMSCFFEKNLYEPVEEMEIDADLKSENLSDTQTEIGEPPEPVGNLIAAESENIDLVDESLEGPSLKKEKDSAIFGEKERPEKETVSVSQEITTGNLNAFVCPPELENKEDEIQHERRKKMQEIVENIGLANNLTEKRRDLSIIDKLKDKIMSENINQSPEDAENGDEDTSEKTRKDRLEVAAPNLILLTEPETIDTEDLSENAVEDPEGLIKTEADEHSSEITRDDAGDKNEKKLKDPLADLDEPCEDDDENDSDIETIPEQQPSFESDTSTEQSDSEVAADVTSLLEETFNIGSTVNAPMMTTIQRLAAKLQGKESFPGSSGDDSIPEKNDESNEGQRPERIIPQKPNVIPIANLEKFWDKRNAVLQEVAKEMNNVTSDNSSSVFSPLSVLNMDVPSSKTSPGSPEKSAKSPAKSPPKSPEKTTLTPSSSPPKKFIRLRRLSGDKLSVPSPVEAPAEIKPIEISQPSSIDGNSSDPNADVLQTDTEEECSFLRIENVVSLAPGADGTEIIDDIRKIPTKSPGGVSLLKKGTPSILKRPIVVPITSNPATATLTVRPVTGITTSPKPPMGNYIPIRPAPVTKNIPIRPAPPGGKPPPQIKQNFKILKVVRGLTLLKQKDTAHRCYGLKLKNPETFNIMLEPVKLRHFYKCMARNCPYTTDCQHSFGIHYRQHKENVDRTKNVMSTYDFQRCPYCTETLTTWNAMYEHLKDKHVHCQYQCGYCFYRGMAQSYVEIHQRAIHPLASVFVLYGQKSNVVQAPMEGVSKREVVIPFVCQHECGKAFYVPGAFLAHLRIKHGNSMSIFKCHLCPAPSFKAETLISHYKLHGIYKYQCIYCLFGSEELSDVHSHLSSCHYNRPAHVLERALQPRPVRDRDVLQQLLILKVDETYKCKDLFLVPGQDPVEVPINKNWIQIEKAIANVGSNDALLASGDITLPVMNIGMNRIFGYDQPDPVEIPSTSTSPGPGSGNVTPLITTVRKVVPKKSPENILVLDDNGTVRKISKRKEPLRERLLRSPTPELMTPNSPSSVIVTKTTSLPSTSSSPPCTSEFVNVNILDNPELLKICVDPVPGQVELRDDDSDIEIIEDISPPSKNPLSTPEKAPDSEKEDTSKEEIDKSDDNYDESQPLVICSSNENSMDATAETSKSESKFLTLDDIRSTGFAGVHLYRCGYDGCTFGAETASLLRAHIKECLYNDDVKSLNCVHCNKRFLKIGFLLEHFKLHGLKRFGCTMCNDRWPMSYQAMSHMKLKHKQTYTKLVPADPLNPSSSGLFVVAPIPTNGSSRTKKRGRVKSGDKDVDKSAGPEKLSFGPNEIEALPRQAIYQREIHCAVCPYTTKVRTNIIRHLQLHAKDETVPESGPVNPVPCLDKKERMFDKMVNLASSSHQNGRMGGKAKEPTTDTDAELLPKFVPERKRYVCGVTNCNYLTCDETMLRYHLKALHPDETFYRCPHCPAPAPGHETQNVAIDKMAVHLKMHDSRLYKCSHCNNHHYHRHVVERHLSDKHSEANACVKVIREPDTTEVQQSGSQEEGDEGSADTEGNHWKCNLCDYKCVYKTEMVAHASTNHEEKGQFKCSACSYKTNNKISFDQHVNAKHPYDLNADCILAYQKIKGVGVKKSMTDSNDSGPGGEPFDTTPLWRRNMPRVRHIRGILFEDENPSKSEGKSNKRKSDTELSGKPVKTKPGKSTISEASIEDSLWTSALLSDNSISDSIADLSESSLQTEASSTPAQYDMSVLMRKFGPLGAADGLFYCCTVCQTFKTKYKHDMRFHLFRDLRYWRYRCTICGHSAVNKTASLQHFQRVHDRSRRPTEAEAAPLPVNPELEAWVTELLKTQRSQMQYSSSNVRRTSTESSQKVNANITQSPIKESSTKPKTVNLASTISDAKKKNVTKDQESSELEDIVIDDDDSSNDALVIDNRDGFEDEEFHDDAPSASSESTTGSSKTPLTCKHCNATLTTIRSFKYHVQLRHLKRNTFLCAYCDTSLSTVEEMTRHLKILHRGRQLKVVRNPTSNLPDLTPEFWEKEYNITTKKKTKKRKLNEDDLPIDPLDKSSEAKFHICHKCGFRALNYFGLKVHLRRHDVQKDYKCAYCSYFAISKDDLWQHSELNHSNLDWKVGNGEFAFAEKSEPDKNEGKDGPDNASTSRSSEQFVIPKSDILYSCFYCDSGKTTFEGVEEHWRMEHKNPTPGETSTQPGLPFRYNEIPSTLIKNALRCGYCPKRGTAAQIRLHSRKKHATKLVKFVEVLHQSWLCGWCDEVCETEQEKKVHHNLYHSHLVPKFKRRENNMEVQNQECHECPECPFKTASRQAMEKHLEKHVDSVICKRCDKTFRDVSEGIRHNTQVHPRDVSKIEGFKTNVEKLMSRVKWAHGNQDKNTFETVGRSALEGTWKNSGVARKSTTKSVVHPKPSDIRSVARKSTNPLPRYPPGMRFYTPDDGEDPARERNVSYYGKAIVPVNLTNINTYITFGGRRMKLTCSALSQLIDIEPSVVVEDVKRDSKRFKGL